MSINIFTINCNSCTHCVAGEYCEIKKKWLTGDFIFCFHYEKYVKKYNNAPIKFIKNKSLKFKRRK